jgi:7-cyano-7-deazaguanine synthase in queuosine biosynthesis
MRNILILNSGGMDSLAVAKLMRQEYPASSDVSIRSLFVGTGLPNESRSRIAARAVAATYCDSHDELFVRQADGSEADLARPLVGHLFGVPYYSLMMLTFGLAYGMRHNCHYVVSGMKPDALGPGYMDALKTVLAESLSTSRSTWIKPQLLMPVLEISNDDIFSLIKDDPLFSQTVSCNQAEPCGRCGKCILRTKLGVPL